MPDEYKLYRTNKIGNTEIKIFIPVISREENDRRMRIAESEFESATGLKLTLSYS